MPNHKVIITIYGYVPKHSRRYYYTNNGENKNTLLNYMMDEHGRDDKAAPSEKMWHSPKHKVFDKRLGWTSIDKVPQVHPKSIVFSGIISLDENTSKTNAFRINWEDMANKLFEVWSTKNQWDLNYWEMQSIMHTNTNNKHLQYRIYMNDKAPVKEVYKWFMLDKDSLFAAKKELIKLIEAKEQYPVLNFNHVIKGAQLHHNNLLIKQYKTWIKSFTLLLRKTQLTEQTKPIIIKMVNKYFEIMQFDKVMNKQLKSLNLNQKEELTIRNIIKNNIKGKLLQTIQTNKVQLVIPFIQNAEHQNKSRFKNFNKISKTATFQTLARYNPVIVARVYAEPMSKFIDFIFHKENFDALEINKSINNYIKEIRPQLKHSVQLDFHKAITL